MADLMTLLSGNDDLYTEIIKENLDQRVLVLNDEINDSVLENYILYIIKWNREDKDIPVDKRKPITVYVNSPGGSSMDGFNLCDVIMQSKTPVRGICFALAASMGYHIYLSCHDRIAWKNSIFLQHDGEVCVSNSRSKAKDTMKFFDSMEERTKQYVLERTKMTEEFYDKIYEQEYWMYADEAKGLGVVDRIIGIDCTLDEIL